MPNTNVERAVKKGTGESGESFTYEEIVYEGYGPGGVAVLVDIMTDNRNRASSSIRHLFSSRGGGLGETGCVAWIFEPKGIFLVKPKGADLDSSMLELIDLGAEDVTEDEDGNLEVVCALEDFEELKRQLASNTYEVLSAEITKLPKNTIKIEDPKVAGQLLNLLDDLDENEDVQKAYANFDISEEILAAIK
jgi:YebC/PmpR family DNA-binding regulatory protein